MTAPRSRSQERSHGHGRRRGALGVLTLVLALTTGCAGVYPDAAAVVNGTTIPESDLDAVAKDLQPYLQPGQSLPRQNVLTALIVQPFVADRLKASNTMVSLDQAANELHRAAAQGRSLDASAVGPQEWSRPTKALAQAQIGLETLSAAERDRVADAIAKAKISVNPRYGEFEPPGRISPPVENWIEPQASGASPTLNQPQPR